MNSKERATKIIMGPEMDLVMKGWWATVNAIIREKDPQKLKKAEEAFDAFIARGVADLDAQNDKGLTAMHLLARANKLKQVRALSLAGADASIPDNQGKTLLSDMIITDNIEMIKAAGPTCCVTQPIGKDGIPPVAFALYLDHREMYYYLRARGATLLQKDNHGKLPLTYKRPGSRIPVEHETYMEKEENRRGMMPLALGVTASILAAAATCFFVKKILEKRSEAPAPIVMEQRAHERE